MCVAGVFFFFFKQKTAYEMRISDWSSDVCSSDLSGPLRAARHRAPVLDHDRTAPGRHHPGHFPDAGRRADGRGVDRSPVRSHARGDRGPDGVRSGRSEEHTSELQSLMRISYAVFCLKKKKMTSTPYTSTNQYKITSLTPTHIASVLD